MPCVRREHFTCRTPIVTKCVLPSEGSSSSGAPTRGRCRPPRRDDRPRCVTWMHPERPETRLKPDHRSLQYAASLPGARPIPESNTLRATRISARPADADPVALWSSWANLSSSHSASCGPRGPCAVVPSAHLRVRWRIEGPRAPIHKVVMLATLSVNSMRCCHRRSHFPTRRCQNGKTGGARAR